MIASQRDPVGRFSGSDWSAGIIGLGYVGLPLAVMATRAGVRTVGFDIDKARVEAIGRGTSPVGDITDEDLSARWPQASR